MNQLELFNWLNPINFNPEIHTLIKAKYEGRCQLCYRNYLVGEYIAFNFEKKKGRHTNCNDPNVKKRKQFKRKNTFDPKNRGVKESNYVRKYR